MPASPYNVWKARKRSAADAGEHTMQAFNYAKPSSLADAAHARRRGRRQAAGRRPVAARGNEARTGRARGAGRPGRPRRASRASACPAARVKIGAMTTHAAVAASQEVRASDSGAGGAGRRHRRPPGAQPSARSGGSLANNDPAADYPAAVLGARRDDPHRQAHHRGRRLLQGPVPDGARQDGDESSPRSASRCPRRPAGRSSSSRHRASRSWACSSAKGTGRACAWPSPAPGPAACSRAKALEDKLSANWSGSAATACKHRRRRV